MTRFRRYPQILYHGTSSNHLSSINSGIDVSKCEPIADFGQGFYTTTNFNRACERAILKANIYRRLLNDSSIYPVVIKYRLLVSNLKSSFSGFTYHNRDLNWIQFIYDNRSILHPKKHTYDYVIGYVADGKITELIEDVDNGNISINELLWLVTAGYSDYDQISFNTNQAAKCLIKMGEVKVHEKAKRI